MIFFLSLLFASLSLTNAALPLTMTNPKQFIQSLDGANPDILKDMRAMVKKLIADGEVERQNVITAQNNAQGVFNDADDAKNKAEKARNVAAGLVQTQQEVTNKAIKLEKSTRDAKNEEKKKLDAAQVKADNAAEFLKSEIARINAEKVLLQKIVKKLKTLLPGVDLIEGRLSVVDYIVGRNLLSDSNADRDAVQDIVDKVNAMVGVGEQQRAAATTAERKAKEALADQTTVHNAAVIAHTSASRDLGTAKAKLKSLEDDLATKVSAFNGAKSALEKATDDLAQKKKTRESEEKRLNGEKKTLEDIDVLLKNLLASK